MQKHDKKVAIMTWYTYKNYGTALQASALSHIIKKLGYTSFLIKYLPKGRIEEPQNINIKWFINKVINKLKRMNDKEFVSKGRDEKFENYLNERIVETNICRCYPELYELNNDYDAFVCGSDQIWSPLCYDDKYFLSFVKEPHKMIAYAPSIGTTEIKNSMISTKMMHYINRFIHLSIREEQGAFLIEQLIKKKATVVLDPTLLLNATEWDTYAQVDNIVDKLSDEYIICYFLGEFQKYMNYVKEISKILGIPYYIIPVSYKQSKNNNVVPFDVGPSEFIYLIRNAKYVCTDSFHGMAFAINYNIPFNVFKRFENGDPENQNSRIINLLRLLNLEKRLVDYESKIFNSKQLLCDFTEANIKLSSLRENSMEYLEKSLEEAVNYEYDEAKSKDYSVTDLCCGCGACATICPMNAIIVNKNQDGFEHFIIDQDKCIHCGSCKTVCPMINVIAPDMNKSISLYSSKSNSKEVIKSSSSGGVGYEIARLYQSKGYFIAGCIYDSSNNIAKHIIIKPNEIEQLKFLQGSKYIQSVSAEAIYRVSEIAKSDKVVFFGTPCQVAAMDKLLRKKHLRDNVILVDLICHGVPSQNLWEKHLNGIDLHYKTGTNPSVVFRTKDSGWRRRVLTVSGNGHTYKEDDYKDDFYAFFRRGLCHMESCYDCPYRERSASDLRIGDYWGNRFIDDKEGVSMVIVNTNLGLETLKTLSEICVCDIHEQEVSDYWKVQYPYNSMRPIIREQLIEELKDRDILLHDLRIQYCDYYDQIEKIVRIKTKLKQYLKRG